MLLCRDASRILNTEAPRRPADWRAHPGEHDRKKKAPLGAGPVLSVLPDMPFDPEPYIPCGCCSLLERWPHLVRWATAIYFPPPLRAMRARQKKQSEGRRLMQALDGPIALARELEIMAAAATLQA
jgi:hypothetical protein